MQLRLAITAQLVDIDEITKGMVDELTPLTRAGQNISRVASAGMVGAAGALAAAGFSALAALALPTLLLPAAALGPWPLPCN